MNAKIKESISGKRDDFVADLKNLVNIDSSSDNPAGIEEVAQVLMPRLEAIGFTTLLEKLGERGVPCLLAFNSAEGETSDIMFLGHMDTVFPPGEAERRPFAVASDRATGPGVCDMQGGLLVAVYVLETLDQAGVLDGLKIRVCFNGDEEVGSAASRGWIKDHARNSRRVFVFEPCRPGHRFVLRRKGWGGYRIQAQGESAHAGVEPEKGANAIVEIAHQVHAVQQFNESVGEGISAHVTTIRGGEKTNIIPDEASAYVDVRVSSKNEIEKVEAFFQSLPNHTHVPGVGLTVHGGVDRPPMEPDEQTFELWGMIEDRAVNLGMQIEHICTGGCSDGNWSSALGIPTIDGMGIVGANAHRQDEYVELDSILPQIQLIASVCQSIARQSYPSGSDEFFC
jgi:glutamate carboxypeptidase